MTAPSWDSPPPAAPWWDSHPPTEEDRDRLRRALWKQAEAAAAARDILVECPCSRPVSLDHAARCHHCGLVLCRECADRHFGPGPKTWDPDWKAENERARCASGSGGEDVVGRARGASKGKPCACYLGACHRDRLGEGWYCQLEEQIASDVKRRLDDHVDRFERIEAKIADLESRVARL